MTRKRAPKSAIPAKTDASESSHATQETAAAGSPREALVVVDRREGDVVVIIGDDGAATDVPAVQLPAAARREGAVLRVPLDGEGAPVWARATRDRAEEKRRREDMIERLRRLKRTDPGGDVVL